MAKKQAASNKTGSPKKPPGKAAKLKTAAKHQRRAGNQQDSAALAERGTRRLYRPLPGDARAAYQEVFVRQRGVTAQQIRCDVPNRAFAVAALAVGNRQNVLAGSAG